MVRVIRAVNSKSSLKNGTLNMLHLVRCTHNRCENRQEATQAVVVASVLASISLTEPPQRQRTDFDLEIEAHLNGVMNSLSVTDRKKEQIKKGYEDDTDMCALKDIIMSGWPKEQTNCSECVQPYWNYRG